MDATTIRFIGLFVMLLKAPDYQILMPHFQHLAVKHESVIAYRAKDRDKSQSNWAGAGKFWIGDERWEYVVVHKQAITVDGNGELPNKDPLNKLPHLSCCCAAYIHHGIKEEYWQRDWPPDKKKGAQVSIKKGKAEVVLGPEVEPPHHARRRDMLFRLDGPGGVTITGTQGEGQPPGHVDKIVFHPGAQIVFGNTALCIIKHEQCETKMHPGDFAAYYRMAFENNDCKGGPSECKTCKDSETACSKDECPPYEMMTVDCSSSGWP
jgi:hypothetical protein